MSVFQQSIIDMISVCHLSVCNVVSVTRWQNFPQLLSTT